MDMKLPWIETQAFKGRVVLITGAGRGIGEGLARRFAEAGALVVMNDIIDGRVHEAACRLREIGLPVTPLVADITRPESARDLVHRCVELCGRLDVFVSSAGFSERKSLLEIDEAYWDRIQGVNLKGPFFCLQAAARAMIERGEGGRIVFLTSIGAYAAQMHLAAYSAAKAGLNLLTKAAAVELAPYQITVNAVGPGAVEGPWNEQFFQDPDYRRRWMATAPLRRLATNDDIAGAVLFLASAGAGYITGQILYVEGGKLAYVPNADIIAHALGQSSDRDEGGNR
ncbi:MAG TPA: SDR family oxidoreductase [Acidobacteriota bacterium]|nr:SDR family oxidoreductase [Acidobacteriota bacterium]